MIEFLLFFIYVTTIFFLSNAGCVISGACMITLAYCLLRRIKLAKVLQRIVSIMPFILLTFGFNALLDNLQSAVFIALKLLIVCCMTLTYSQTISVLEFARIISSLLSPLRRFGLNTDEVCLVICLAMSMIPILRREIIEIKYAMRAKGMNLNMRNTYYVITRLFIRSIRRVDELDMALRARGIE